MYLRASKDFEDHTITLVWEVKPDGLYLMQTDCNTPTCYSWDEIEDAWGIDNPRTMYEWDILTKDELFLEMI